MARSRAVTAGDPQEGRTAGERAGSYMDHELAADLGAGGTNASANFVFIDACYSQACVFPMETPSSAPSGGLIEELLTALPSVVGTTTCTRKGYGYDCSSPGGGARWHRHPLRIDSERGVDKRVPIE